MSTLVLIFTIIQLLAGLFLIAVVLLQSGKEAGLSGALTGASESYMNKNKKGGFDKMLATSTKWIALAWILLTLVLSLV